MNITNLLSSIGLGDGQGNVSSMRVIVSFVVLSVLLPAEYSAFVNHTNLILTPDNLATLAGALGFKCVQNAQENSTQSATTQTQTK